MSEIFQKSNIKMRMATTLCLRAKTIGMLSKTCSGRAASVFLTCGHMLDCDEVSLHSIYDTISQKIHLLDVTDKVINKACYVTI